MESDISLDESEEVGIIGRSRRPSLSKVRLTYGLESRDGRSTDDVNIPATHFASNSSSTAQKFFENGQDTVIFNTKETISNEKEQLRASESSNSASSHVQLSGNTKIKISSPSFAKTKEKFSLLRIPSRKMDKSSTSTTAGSSGSGNPGEAAGEKRPSSSMSSAPQDHHNDENEDESKKKKQKTSSTSNTASASGVSAGASTKDEGSVGKDSLPTSASSSVSSVGGTVGTTLGKGGRSTRGSSSEKTTGMRYCWLLTTTNNYVSLKYLYIHFSFNV